MGIRWLFFMIFSGMHLYALIGEECQLYFHYPKTLIEGLSGLNTSKSYSWEELKFWDEEAARLLQDKSLKDGTLLRLYAYLYTAQSDAALLMSKIKGANQGTLAPISAAILNLFFPKYRPPFREKDPLSDATADVIASIYKKRFDQENKEIFSYQQKEGADYWKDAHPYGLTIGSFRPWHARTINQYRLPPPSNSPVFWEKQLQAVRSAISNCTTDQRDRILFWAGTQKKGSGDWLVIANEYMIQKNVPLSKALCVRSQLAIAILDTMIAAFDTKYTHFIKRPHMRDGTITPLIHCPEHPSFPSGHSSSSAAAAVLLSHAFPENQKEWEHLAWEAGQSRIWAGIHFPVDDAQGCVLGEKIGTACIKQGNP